MQVAAGLSKSFDDEVRRCLSANDDSQETPMFHDKETQMQDSPECETPPGNRCKHCGIEALTHSFCYSCASITCSRCMGQGPGDTCIPCQRTFPVWRSKLSGHMQDQRTSLKLAQLCDPYTEEAAFAEPQEPRPIKILPEVDMQPKAKRQTKKPRRANNCKKDPEQNAVTYNDNAALMMIRNIPCPLDQDDIAFAIESMGFAGLYDFVHVPVPHHPQKSKGNKGYAFVQFFDPEVAVQFQQSFQGHQFEGTASTKKCTVELGCPKNSKVPAK